MRCKICDKPLGKIPPSSKGRKKYCSLDCKHEAFSRKWEGYISVKQDPLYSIWLGMRSRCNNPRSPEPIRKIYFGIIVYDKWNSFKGFREWAYSNGFKKGLTIHRKDKKAGYCPSNCEWLPPNKHYRMDALERHQGKKRGVTRYRTKWKASIKSDQERIYLGLFIDKEDAYNAFFSKYVEIHGVQPW